MRLHAPELQETIARRLVEIVGMVRDLDLKKPPSIAESIDWARALLLLGAQDVDRAVFEETLSVIVKHRTDLDLVAERVGVKLEQRAPAGRSSQISLDLPARAWPALVHRDELKVIARAVAAIQSSFAGQRPDSLRRSPKIWATATPPIGSDHRRRAEHSRREARADAG